tara:strand:+ start:3429 stop:4259 length:831 start_codon:yes stop_codon:yes gene_type:complete
MSLKSQLCVALAFLFSLGATTVVAQGTADRDLPAVPDMPIAETDTATAIVETVGQDPNAIRVLLSPELETILAAQMVGRVEQVDAGLGAEVKKGQVLVRFNCTETSARLDMAKAEVAGARETLGVKQRLRKLDAAGNAEVTLARIEVQKGQAAVDIAQAQLEHCEIKAPFDGRVVKVHVKPFQTANVGDPLVALVSGGPLKIRMNVPSNLLDSVQVGSPIEVGIFETGQTYPAEVSRVNARVDAIAQTIELEAVLTEVSSDLLPGMSGIARIIEPT